MRCKELFKINSEIRDFDIIYEKLQKYPPNSDRDKIIEDLKVTRTTRIERAKEIALPLKNTDISKILGKIDVKEKDLQKRYSKILSRFVSKIESTFPIIITDASKIEELHTLRKTCKKLRYLLELLPADNKTTAGQIIKMLKKLQDILGTIHDYDFTIQHLKSVENPTSQIPSIIDAESKERKLKYEQFVKYCRRRLHIYPDSLLIKIRSPELFINM
jgi:CHAD domain-containing protein